MTVITHAKFVLSDDGETITGVDEVKEYVCPTMRAELDHMISFYLLSVAEGAEN